MFIQFIWNNKHPSVRISLPYLPYDRGGLKLLNIILLGLDDHVAFFGKCSSKMARNKKVKFVKSKIPFNFLTNTKNITEKLEWNII